MLPAWTWSTQTLTGPAEGGWGGGQGGGRGLKTGGWGEREKSNSIKVIGTVHWLNQD